MANRSGVKRFRFCAVFLLFIYSLALLASPVDGAAAAASSKPSGAGTEKGRDEITNNSGGPAPPPSSPTSSSFNWSLSNPIVASTLLTLLVPGLAMMLGNALSFMLHVSEHTMASLQCFASGIILAAVGCELLPALHAAQTMSERLGTLVGFFGGCAIMFAIKKATDMLGDDEIPEEDPRERQALLPMGGAGSFRSGNSGGAFRQDSELMSRRRSMVGKVSFLRNPEELPLIKRASAANTVGMASLKPPVERSWAEMPWGMVASVLVNGLMDGLLLGIAYVANEHAGWIMAIATAVEMAFLGVTFSAALNSFGWKSIPITSMPPALMVVGCAIGSSAAKALESNPAVFLGLIAFGVVALLFLVTQELLHEVHESEAHEHWHVNACLYLGFLAVVVEEWITSSLGG